MIRAFLYARVSSEEQRQQQTIRTQLNFAEQYASFHKLQWAAIFADDGVSGSFYHLHERPEGKRLLETVRPGDTVYVTKIDRLGRGIRVILAAVDGLESRGAAVRSLTEPLDTSTPTGKFLLSTLAAVAELDRDSIVERMTAGVQRKAREGGWTGGNPPYGYRIQGLKREARLVPEEEVRSGETFSRADVVRLIYRLALEEGAFTGQIAEYLNSLRIPTAQPAGSRYNVRSGRPNLGVWSAAAVYSVLANRTYTGERDFGKLGAQEVVRQSVPALVPLGTWEQVQRQVRGRRLQATDGGFHWLLSGLLRCGRCGNRYHAYLARGRAKAYRYYHCGSRRRVARVLGGAGTCPNPTVSAACEEEVWQRCRHYIEHPETVGEWLATQHAPPPREVDERAGLEARLLALELERKRLLGLYRRGVIGDTDLEEQLAEVRQEDGALRLRLAETCPLDVSTTRQVLDATQERLRGLQPALTEGDTPELRRRVLLAVGPRLTVVAGETVRGRVTGRVEFRLF